MATYLLLIDKTAYLRYYFLITLALPLCWNGIQGGLKNHWALRL